MNSKILAALAVVISLGTLDAHANLIMNGDFETGDLTGWTTFTTPNGTIGTPSVSSFDTTGSGASLAAVFNVGNIQNPGNNGGGIFQMFSFGGGSLSVSVDVATMTGNASNGDAGEFSLLVNGSLVDFLDFSNIDFNATERGTLSGVVNGLSAGQHEIRLLMTRQFETASNTPFQHIDNATAIGIPVSAPATLALFGLGLAGLGWARRNKS